MPASQAQEGLDLVDGQGTCFQKLKKRRRAVHHVYESTVVIVIMIFY